MFKHFLRFYSIAVISLFISGCTNVLPENKIEVKNKKENIFSKEYNYDVQLKHCLNESEYLMNKNKTTYGRINTALIQMLLTIKDYSSQTNKIDEKNREIITSMYVFQTNDLCNTISQHYLAEIKDDLSKIIDKTQSKQ